MQRRGSFRFVLVFVMTVAVVALATGAHADATFEYVGNTFSDTMYATSLGTSVDATVTFDDSVINYTGKLDNRNITSIDIRTQDGANIILDTPDALSGIGNEVSIHFEKGAIDDWFIQAYNTGTECITTFDDPHNYFSNVLQPYSDDLVTSSYSQTVDVSGDPGAWLEQTSIPTPEPASIFLVLSSLIGTAGFKLWKKARLSSYTRRV